MHEFAQVGKLVLRLTTVGDLKGHLVTGKQNVVVHIVVEDCWLDWYRLLARNCLRVFLIIVAALKQLLDHPLSVDFESQVFEFD